MATKQRIPRQKSLDEVCSVVKANPSIKKVGVISKSRHTRHCVDLCLELLILQERISRTFIRMSGPYKVYEYK